MVQGAADDTYTKRITGISRIELTVEKKDPEGNVIDTIVIEVTLQGIATVDDQGRISGEPINVNAQLSHLVRAMEAELDARQATEEGDFFEQQRTNYSGWNGKDDGSSKGHYYIGGVVAVAFIAFGLGCLIKRRGGAPTQEAEEDEVQEEEA